jgi:DNA-binding response OmpR family regulator
MSNPDPVQSRSILLVDDEAMVVRLLSISLRAAGYKVVPAANGNDALAALSKSPEPIHLLVTDINLPGMSGIELASRAGHNASLPVLLISGLPLPPEGKSPGWHYLPKPFAPAQFVGTVKSILAKNGDGDTGNSRH